MARSVRRHKKSNSRWGFGPLLIALLVSLGQVEPLAAQSTEAAPCEGGMADVFPCSNLDLMSRVPLGSMGGGSGNDVWGWTDPVTGDEYALVGRSSGTAFVNVSNPQEPVYVGNLPTHSSPSSWRDVKVYGDYALIVSEAGGHGMQVFDLTQLRAVVSPPVTFAETAHYDGFGSAHNIVVNQTSGFAYGVGTESCSGGLHMIDVSAPTSPLFAGCFSADGYTHDAQCVDYIGPDPDHQGSEICFNANEDTLTIVDVTNKNAPVQLARSSYAGREYAHQGWLTEDHVHFLLDDELDELNRGFNTRTYIWDVSDLDNPGVIGIYTGPETAIDHNQYVRGDRTYQANYSSGLRVLDITDIASGSLNEVAFFDTYPWDNTAFQHPEDATFNGAWSVYPYFDSGVLIVSTIEDGLFVLQPSDDGGGGDDEYEMDCVGGPGGDLTCTVINGAPFARNKLMRSRLIGAATVPVGPCTGTTTGLGTNTGFPQIRIFGNAVSDAGGTSVFQLENVPGSACGMYLQAIDNTGTCAVSSVIQLTDCG